MQEVASSILVSSTPDGAGQRVASALGSRLRPANDGELTPDLTPEHRLHGRASGADCRRDWMAVDLKRHARGRMAHDVGHVLDPNARRGEQRDGRVPELVRMPVAEAGPHRRPAEGAAEVA